MKRSLLLTVLAAGLSTSPAFAQDQHQHGQAAETTESDPQAGMMMGSDTMQEHRQRMQEMRALMQQAHAANGPAERQRLMAEHRQKMQEHMAAHQNMSQQN
jgi:hypothetical protein